MPVTFDASNFIQTSTTEAKVTLTVASDATLVVAVFSKGTADQSVSGVQANNTALTRLVRIDADAVNNANPVTLDVYCLTAAPSGTVSISAQMVGAAVAVNMYAGTYLGVRAVDGIHVVDSGSLTSVDNVVAACSTSTTDRVVWFAGNHFPISATNASIRHTATSLFGSFMADTAGPANTVNLSATASTIAATNMIAFAALNLIATATAQLVRRSLLGVGL